MSENVIQYFEKMVNYDYPCCKVEWLYNQENIAQNKNIVNKTLIKMIGVIRELCVQKSDVHLLIRVHVFKGWCVLRIVARYVYQRQFIDNLIEQYCGPGGAMLFDASQEDQIIVIRIGNYIGD